MTTISREELNRRLHRNFDSIRNCFKEANQVTKESDALYNEYLESCKRFKEEDHKIDKELNNILASLK